MRKKIDMPNRDELKRQEQEVILQIASHERTRIELAKKRIEEEVLIKRLKSKLEQIKYELSKFICNHCNCVIDNDTYSTDGIDGIFCSKRCLLEEVGNRIKCEKTNNEDDKHSVRIDNENDGNCKIGIVGEDHDPWFEIIKNGIKRVGCKFTTNEVYWLIIRGKEVPKEEDNIQLDYRTCRRIAKILRTLGYASKVMHRTNGANYRGWYDMSIEAMCVDEWFDTIKYGVVKLGTVFNTTDAYNLLTKKYQNLSKSMDLSSKMRIGKILRYLGYVPMVKTINKKCITVWIKQSREV